jgi:hypothetical protein
MMVVAMRMQMVMGMGMLVLVGMFMMVFMGMGMSVMGMLVSMGMGMLVAVSANMVVMDVHGFLRSFKFALMILIVPSIGNDILSEFYHMKRGGHKPPGGI